MTVPVGWRLGLSAAAVAGALGLGGLAWADEEAPRYSPATRGPRASYGTERVERWRPLLDAYPWPTETALLVVACESEGRPDAVNAWSGAAGLFQEMPTWRPLARFLTGWSDLTDPFVNAEVAYYLWRDSGGSFRWHWASSVACWGW